MRFVYGAQDWTTRERGQENCYLLTNGLGGFSSGTIIGSNARNDHALFMACTKAPNNRVNVVNHLKESVRVGEKTYSISTQDYIAKDRTEKENGYEYQLTFQFEDYPEWTYLVDGVEIQKKIVMKQGENTVVVTYEIENRSGRDATFIITPYFQFTKKGENMEQGQFLKKEGNKISSNGYSVFFWTNGEVEETKTEYVDDFFYAYDICDGRREYGRCGSNHTIQIKVLSKEKRQLVLLYSTNLLLEDPSDAKLLKKAKELFAEEVAYRKELVNTANLTDPMAQMLVKSANQFVSERESTKGKTILAGYPFFEDWGRDTMIAMAGCCISTRQFATAKEIFRTFMQYCHRGIMPNLFPEGDHEPMYNTVDASLLFINTVYLYFEQTNDMAFVKECYPVMEEIIGWYKKGTDFGIHMDEDGLIMAGKGLDQVTWMDVRIGEILPTPRHGKPVEINAYWYSALKIMEKFTKEILLDEETAKEYGALADRVKKSFNEAFWNEEKQCLKDVISDEEAYKKAEDQIRCNQIWAISMPFTMLDQEKETKVVDKVYETLYTPCGLRSLAKEEDEFHPVYGGEQRKRDLAYHQGTVWGFPLGAYYLAYLKVNHFSDEAKKTVRRQLSVLENTMREGCVGQIAEIYDGLRPVRSHGCFAQAWSTGELLRAYEALER